LERSSNKPHDSKIWEPLDETNTGKPPEDPMEWLVGAHKSFMQPQFPRRDDIVSKGKTPEEKGARPCQHCGSRKHWDSDHPIHKEDEVRSLLADLDHEALKAYVAYEDYQTGGGSNNNITNIKRNDPMESSDEESSPTY